MRVGVYRHVSAALPPGQRNGTIIHEAGWAPRPVGTGAENLTPTRIRSADRSARKQSLHRNSIFFEILPTFNSPSCVASFQLQIISWDVLQIERKMNWPFLLPKEAGEGIQISYRHAQDFERLIVQSHNTIKFIGSSEERHERKSQPYSASV